MVKQTSKKLWTWLKKDRFDIFFSIILIVVSLFIAFRNYTPGTYLTGWDNLHPEFNLKLSIERSLNAAWQEYQGVGLLGGMAHAADLPRQLLFVFLTVIIPVSFIRYFWTFLMLFAGAWGVYFLIKDKSRLGGITASMFYIFNLATVQYFFVPFETFVGFFGFLPWLMYFGGGYLKTGKGLLKYLLISVLATSAFYVQTLFIVYVVFLLVLALGAVFQEKLKGLKKVFKLGIVTFIANAFWLLPALWFSVTSGDIPSLSDINRIATLETVYMNQARNDFKSLITQKGYWFDYFDFQVNKDDVQGGEFKYLFEPWISYSSKPWVVNVSIILFALSVIGLLLGRQFSFLMLSVISVLMLVGITPPTSVLQEAFRNSFTKWSVAFAFLLSIGLGHFVAKFKKYFVILPALVIVSASIYTVLPVFEGRLFSERVKVEIPKSYFESYEWFNSKSNGGRVAFLPYFDKWGWNYHSWGHGGSGFIWYGIKNPILDRAFNVWSPYNEGFYDEVTNAINSNDKESFSKTLSKYQVSYLYLDDSIVFPWGDRNLLKLDRTKEFAESLGFLKVAEFDFISVYDTGYGNNKFINALNDFSYINVNTKYATNDAVYAKYGNYVTSQDGRGIVLPFVNFDARSDVQIDVQIKETDSALQFINKKLNTTATVQIRNRIVESFEPSHGYPEENNCELNKKGSVEREFEQKGRKYSAFDGGIACDYFVYSSLGYDKGYVLKVKGKNIAGRGLKLYLLNWATQRVELEELLPEGEFENYFVIYPKPTLISEDSDLSAGYTLNIETRSFGKVASENIVEAIEFMPFDINLITNIQIDDFNSTNRNYANSGNLKILNVSKWGTSLYKVQTEGSGILQLGQGYDGGWVAVSKTIKGSKLHSHFRVNTWSNGWEINNESIVYLVFWPQMLEWIGLLILIPTFVVLKHAK